MWINRFGLAGVVAAGLATALVRPALAQQAYPNRPVRFIVPSAVGNQTDISARLLAGDLSSQFGHVPYKGTPQVITDVMGGQIQVLCDNMGSVLPHVRAGRLRGLGVTAAQRLSAVPELPTIAESGLPGYEVAGWSGTIVPARVSREIVVRLNVAINKALFSSAVMEKFASYGSTSVGGTPEQFAEHVRRETAKWASVIKDAGIKPG